VKAILVTGSRDWTDRAAIRRILELVCAAETERGEAAVIVLIHGDCRGADRIAGEAFSEWHFPVMPMPAPWERGKTAGTGRNHAMLCVLEQLRFCSYDCEVHAFPLPSSRGTRHMMRIARDAGFTVHDHGNSHG
jgi:hypothetical protein